MVFSTRNSPRQSATAESFAGVSSVLIVISSAKILRRWLFLSKIYIQFTSFNIYFSTKLSFANKRCHFHVLEKRLYVLQEVRSIIYFRQFIHLLSLRSRGNGTSFVFTSYILKSAKFCNVSFLNNFYFHSFTICSSAGATDCLPIVHLPALPIVYLLFICETLGKSYLYNFFF